LHEVAEMAGVSLPSYLGNVAETKPTVGNGALHTAASVDVPGKEKSEDGK
jgi:hypothetical protein